MSKNIREGDYCRLLGVICFAIFFVSSAFVQAAPPVAESLVVPVTDSDGVGIQLPATDDVLEPLELSYIITSLPQHGRLFDPNVIDLLEITEADIPYIVQDPEAFVIYKPCPYYLFGDDAFSFKANDGGIPPDGGDSNVADIDLEIDIFPGVIYDPDGTPKWDYIPFMTYFKKVRCQAIYHADELGSKARNILSLALNIETTPSIQIENWTIRMKHTTKTEYLSTDTFDNTPDSWTTVYYSESQSIIEPNETLSWQDFSFQTPFPYNGTDNLMIDFSFDSTTQTDPGDYGYVYDSETTDNRIISHWANSGDPLTFDTTGTKWDRLFNIILQGEPERLYGDLNDDCQVDLNDFMKLAEGWDDVYDINDLVGLCGEWLEEIE